MEDINKHNVYKTTKIHICDIVSWEIISQELRNQVTIILSSAELLDRYSDQWTQTEQRKYLDLIKTAITQMTDKFHPDLINIEAN